MEQLKLCSLPEVLQLDWRVSKASVTFSKVYKREQLCIVLMSLFDSPEFLETLTQ